MRLPTLAELPNQRSFGIGTYCAAQMLAMSLPMGEVMLDGAASFYDGLVVQRALDAAHGPSKWSMAQTLTKRRCAPIMGGASH